MPRRHQRCVWGDPAQPSAGSCSSARGSERGEELTITSSAIRWHLLIDRFRSGHGAREASRARGCLFLAQIVARPRHIREVYR